MRILLLFPHFIAEKWWQLHFAKVTLLDVAVLFLFNLLFFTSIHQILFYLTSKEPVCPRVELIFKIIIILLIIFLGFIKSKPC